MRFVWARLVAFRCPSRHFAFPATVMDAFLPLSARHQEKDCWSSYRRAPPAPPSSRIPLLGSLLSAPAARGGPAAVGALGAPHARGLAPAGCVQEGMSG